MAFRRVADLIGRDITIILETPVSLDLMEHEIEKARSILEWAGDEDEDGVLVRGEDPILHAIGPAPVV